MGSDRVCEAGAVYGVWGQTGTVKQGLSMGSDRVCEAGTGGQTMGCGVRQGL